MRGTKRKLEIDKQPKITQMFKKRAEADENDKPVASIASIQGPAQNENIEEPIEPQTNLTNHQTDESD